MVIKIKCDRNVIYETVAENVYEEFWKDKKIYAFISYPGDSKYCNNANNCCRENETCVVPLKGFLGLTPKMNTLITEDNHEPKKANSVNKNVVDDELKHEDYKNVLFNGSYKKNEQKSNKNHNIGLYVIDKIFLPSYDYKKNILKDRCSRLSHFHKSAVKPYKNNFAKYKQFISIFTLVRTATLFIILFPCDKNILLCFVQQYNGRFFPREWKTKKTKAKNCHQGNKEKL